MMEYAARSGSLIALNWDYPSSTGCRKHSIIGIDLGETKAKSRRRRKASNNDA